MAIYTSFEMIEDCQRDRPEGWRYLTTHFVPIFRHLIRHYQPESDRSEFWGRFLRYLREDQASPLKGASPMSEREFVLSVRDRLLAFANVPDNETELDWGGFQEALDSLTPVEKQTVWLEVFGYDNSAAAALMRIYLERADAIRSQAASLLAERLPGFSIRPNGPALHRAAGRVAPENPIPVQRYLRAMDGQLNWSDRQDVDLAVGRSWFEVDRFCLAREADAATREAVKISSDEVAGLMEAAELPAPKPRRRRWLFSAKA